jgi:flagellar basal-body rod modification protein FlgD
MTSSVSNNTSSFFDTLNSNSSASSAASASSSTGAAAAAATSAPGVIDQAGFLKLLTTQMTMQDPTAPMDTNTMVEQLAQMSTVSGITEMNQSLQSLTTQLTGNRIGDAASWIGKTALVQSTSAMPSTDGSFSGEIALSSAATSMTVSLVDANGNTVYNQTLANQPAGLVHFQWDGKLPDGTQAAGPLKIVASAITATGAISPSTASYVPITGVQSPAGGSSAQLNTPLGAIDPTDIIRIS